MPETEELPITNLNQNSVDSATESVEDTIARGVREAIAAGPETAPGPDPATLIIGEKPKRTRRKKIVTATPVLTPEEIEAQRMMAFFFSAEGIGKVWANGLNAFYLACSAAPMEPGEMEMQAGAFSQWARYRLPAGGEAYQPELFLVAAVAMTTLPRMQPIATATAPWWQRLGKRLRSMLPKKVTPGRADE